MRWMRRTAGKFGVFCWLCKNVGGCHADSVERGIVDDPADPDSGDWADLDPYACDMELDGNELSVYVEDGPRRYLAHFQVNNCPCCGRELR